MLTFIKRIIYRMLDFYRRIWQAFLAGFLVASGLCVAVSTGGKSPALARKIRSRLEKELGAEYALVADLISEVRAELKQQKFELDGDGWQEALDLDRLLELVRKGERERAKTTLLTNLKAKQQ